jgi:hypothetical protein
MSDKKDFDLYNPNLLPLLKRDFVICFVSIKDRENINIKLLIEEFQKINLNLVTTQPMKKFTLVAEGPISGLISLSSYLK